MVKRRTAMAVVATVLGLLLLTGAAPPLPKYGPAGAPQAAPLSRDHRFFQDRANPAPDFWALNSFYVPQANDLSCSAASVVAVINALRASILEPACDTPNITEERILADVRASRWRECVTPPGLDGRTGLTLAELSDVVRASLSRYELTGYAVETMEVRQQTPETLERFRRLLIENERRGDDFLIVHFLQDEITRAPGGPFAHISPIGAYDAATKRVLIMDVDRQWYEPYWVSDRILLAAMATPTQKYGHGGYIRIRPAAAP